MAYLFAILGLSLLIVLHEMGHMITARLSGMRVITFSIGFGPALLRWRGSKTTYQLALIPLGGYVQIAGMNPNEKLPPDDPGSYANKSTAARFATIFAGPLTNYLVAILMMVGVALAWGIPRSRHTVEGVLANTPAARGGLKAGDVIERIEGHPVNPYSSEGIPQILAAIEGSAGKPLRFAVRRGGKQQTLPVAPAKEAGGFRIGIKFGQVQSFAAVSGKNALIFGVTEPLLQSQKALDQLGQAVGKLISRKGGEVQVGGPVEIVHQLKLSFEQGPGMALFLLALLSVWLGLFNLLPIPALDGGRLLFLIYTGVARRPVNQRAENIVHTVGFVLLLVLIGLVTYKDLARRLTE